MLFRRLDGNRILLVRHKAFGDVLFTTPFARLIRSEKPHCSIDLHSLVPDAYDAPCCRGEWLDLSRLHIRKALKLGHGQVYWFCYEHDPSLHILDGYELSTGLTLQDRTLSWTVREEERAQAQAALAGLPRPIVGFSPTSAHALRSLPLDVIQQIVDRIRERLDGSLVVTSDKPLELQRCVNLSSEIASMRMLGAVIAQCDAWISVDSGPLHIAQALSIPTVGIFGCTLPELRATRPERLRIVRNERLSCLGCYHGIERGAESLCLCSRGDIACMAAIDGKLVVQALEKALQKEADSELLDRIADYEIRKQKRMSHLTKDATKRIVHDYRARLEKFCSGDSLFRRIERSVRKWRKNRRGFMAS